MPMTSLPLLTLKEEMRNQVVHGFCSYNSYAKNGRADIASTSVARSLAAAKIAKQKLQDAIAKLEDEHGRSSPTIDKKRDDLLSSMSQLEIAFNSVHVQQQLLDWLTPPTFIKKSLK